MAAMEKTVIVMTTVVLMSALMMEVVRAMAPIPPSLDYCCPLCTDVCFATYDELYTHFTTQHPAEDIDISWE